MCACNLFNNLLLPDSLTDKLPVDFTMHAGLHNGIVKHILVYRLVVKHSVMIKFPLKIITIQENLFPLHTRTHTLVYFVSCLHFACYASLCAASIALSLRSACSAFECSTWYRSILPFCNFRPVVEGGQYCRRELLRVDAQFHVISSDWRPLSTREEKRRTALSLVSHHSWVITFFYTY